MAVLTGNLTVTGDLIVDGNISAAVLTIPEASASTLGGVKVGSGLTISDAGVLSVGDLSGTYAAAAQLTSLSETVGGKAAKPGLNHIGDIIIATTFGDIEASGYGIGYDAGDVPFLDPNAKLPASVIPTLTASDVGAAAASHTHTLADITDYSAGSAGSAGPLPTSSQTRYDTVIVGDGYTEEFTITHNLGIKNVIAAVIDRENGTTVIADVKRTSEIALSIIFENAPALGVEYDVVVLR